MVVNYERLSTGARAVMVNAEAEARALGHIHVGSEHMLLALAASSAGGLTRIGGFLQGQGVDVDDLRATVAAAAAAVRRSSAPVLGVIPLAPRVKKILELAVQEAGGAAAGSAPVQPEHLLLAILREGESVACAVLARHRVTSAKVRALMNSEAQAPPAAALRGPLTAGARRVAEGARRTAADDELGTQHLLLALLEESEGVAARVLSDLGVDAAAVRAAVAAASTAGTSDGEPLATVTVGDGVNVPIGDADLAARLRHADQDEVREIVRRALAEHLGDAAEG